MRACKWLVLLLTAVLVAGCGGGGGGPSGGNASDGPVVGDIQGPGSVPEESSAEYSVTRTGSATGVTYQWGVDPASSGSFANQGASSTTFNSVAVSSNTAATIRVVVSSDGHDPVVKAREITIEDKSQGDPSQDDPPDDPPGDDPPPENQPPRAAAHAEPAMINPGWSVQFFDSSTDPNGDDDIVQWEWDISFDSDVGFQPRNTEREPYIQFADVGVYRAQLRVTDSGGLSDMLDEPLEIVVTTDHLFPVAKAVAYPVPQMVCEPIQFQNNGSYSPEGGTIVNYEWDWDGDGTYDEEALFTEHAWDLPGTYYVQFRVTDDEGAMSKLPVPLEIVIENAPPVAIAEASQYVAHVGEPILFDASGSYDQDCYGEIDQWEWDWEDDGTFDDAGETIEHSFSATGIFTIMLRVSDGAEQTAELDTPLQVLVEEATTSTWGGDGDDWGYGVAIDDSGNVYVTGCYWYTVDFDPGPGEEELTGYDDAFLTKFDSTGDFLWARSWEGDTSVGYDVLLDCSDGVYVTGYFDGTVDFDPGAGTDARTGYYDSFLSKFNSNGDFLWVRAWGGSGGDCGSGLALDSYGNLYVTGGFTDTVDFTSGSFDYASNGGSDAYLAKFDSGGGLAWARTWGASNNDRGYDVAVDSHGDPYVTGSFRDTVDFDPGAGTDEHSSYGLETFLSKFTSGGDFEWARTWGSYEGFGVVVDYSDAIYVAGYYDGNVDFNPGPGTDYQDGTGSFLSKFLVSGEYCWARVWGQPGCGDPAYGLTVDNLNGLIYVTGTYEGAHVDFDPGPGREWHHGGGAYLQEIYTSGEWKRARTWGGHYSTEWDVGRDVAVNGFGVAFVTGAFDGYVDFDPGPENETHVSKGLHDVFLGRF